MRPGYIRALLLIYGLMNAVLYVSLLPLWEGIDEEFHYGYVQYLGAHHAFPVLGQTGLSNDINATLVLLPMSYLMIANLHLQDTQGVRTFEQFAALDSSTRHELRAAAERIPSELRLRESDQYSTNYEAQHAPLAYFLMAVPNELMQRVSLPRRVWILRLLLSVACVLLMFRGMESLGREIGLDQGFVAALEFLTFSCQMFWATVAHVDNDWLAVPLAVWLIIRALRCHRERSTRSALWFGGIFSAGLLTKAYFLVFGPLYVLAALLWHRRGKLSGRGLMVLFLVPAILAGPWYVRNLILYGDVSGHVEATNGVTTGGALRALLSIPWLKTIPFMARGAFWMGNASFNDFSVSTMNLLLLLLGIALALWTMRRGLRRDLFLWAPVAAFWVAVIYAIGSLYMYSKGALTITGPWYLQAVMTPLLCMALLGCQRSGRLGRWTSSATVVLWGYILAATYVAKLMPLYGGFPGARSSLRELTHWYLSDWPRTSDILNTVALAPATVLVTLLATLLVTLLAAMTAVLRKIWNNDLL